MTEQEQLKKAIRFAKAAHAGQTDRGGHPYEEHLAAVAGGCETVAQQTVGWLHDIIEDTDVDAARLREEGFAPEIVEAVVLLTKEYTPDFDYYEYLSAICENPLACAVKKSDLLHNMDTSRLAEVTDADREYQRKYEVSRLFLNGDLEAGFVFPADWSKPGNGKRKQ